MLMVVQTVCPAVCWANDGAAKANAVRKKIVRKGNAGLSREMTIASAQQDERQNG